MAARRPVRIPLAGLLILLLLLTAVAAAGAGHVSAPAGAAEEMTGARLENGGHDIGLQAGRTGHHLRESAAERDRRSEVTRLHTGPAALDRGTLRSTGRGGRAGGPAHPGGERRRAPYPRPDPIPCAPPSRSGFDPAGPVPGTDGSGGRGRKDHAPPPIPVTGDAVVPDPALLLRFLLVLGFRRVRPGNVLEHPLRRAAHAAIANEPGLDLAECATATGTNRETLRYHLALLVCCGKVVEETRSGSVRYFPHDPTLTPARRALVHALRNESLAPMLAAIRDAPGISRGELAQRLGVAGPTVTRQVQRLIDEELVASERCGRSTCYRLTPVSAAAFDPARAAGGNEAGVPDRARA